MENIFSPLFARMRQKYTRFPASCGISFASGTRQDGWFARVREDRALLETFSGPDELLQMVAVPSMPEIVCLSAKPEQRGSKLFANILVSLRADNLQVIITEDDLILNALGLSHMQESVAELLQQMGFDLRPNEAHPAVPAVLSALTGYYYINNEYEHLQKEQSIVPLLIDWHPLYAFLRQVPYGEVTTFADAAKSLGLQWNEQTIMEALHQLPAGADVPGHRVVHRDGSISESFPGGPEAQRERLKWELVPMLDKRRVVLKKALWTRNKYRPLTNYLRHSVADTKFLEYHFTELEQVMNQPLPRAARRLGSWWHDDKPHAYIWQDAGCRIAKVNLQMQMVTFSRQLPDIVT